MYYSHVFIDPTNEDRVYTLATSAHRSEDGGRTFREIAERPTYDVGVHADHHSMWIDPADPEHFYLAGDAGLHETYDMGVTFRRINNLPVGQFYGITVDNRDPYWIYGGMQDNHSWMGPSATRSWEGIVDDEWRQSGFGDGMYQQADPDGRTIYINTQNGGWTRFDNRTGDMMSLRLTAPEGEDPYRWDWVSPSLISRHDPNTVYVGGNRLFISRDRGNSFTRTDDLTRGQDRDELEIMGVRGADITLSRNDGTSSYGEIVTMSESPRDPAVLWVGTDDGNVQVSRDGGATWTEVGANIPGGTNRYYVSRVEASHHDPATAYASVDGHRSDDLRPYVYVTRDYGESWEDISSNLPEYGNVNTVRQDPHNPRLLYAGTEFGFFVSLDEGGTWDPFMTGLAVVRVDDVVVHPRDGDLVLATHGRSVLVADDITPLQQFTETVASAASHLFETRDAVRWQQDTRRSRSVTGDKVLRGDNSPAGTAIHYYLADDADEVTLSITNLATGELFRDLETATAPGIHRVQWNLRGNPRRREGGGGPGGFGGFGGQAPLASPGLYRVTLSVDGRTHSQTVSVLQDIWIDQR
jgi:hypothetical protein